jgi:hypothetical protein
MSIYSKQEMFKIKLGVFKVTRLDEQNNKIWCKEEDFKLLQLISLYGESKIKWNDVAPNFNKSVKQCYSRYRQINPAFNQGFWTKEEEDLLSELFQIYGKKWSSIAKLFKTRSSKQIRSHYLNIKNEGNNRESFTIVEDEIIIAQYLKLGPKWQKISIHLLGRTGDVIKCRFYCSLKKKMEANLLKKAVNYSENTDTNIILKTSEITSINPGNTTFLNNINYTNNTKKAINIFKNKVSKLNDLPRNFRKKIIKNNTKMNKDNMQNNYPLAKSNNFK